jgi:hypothetical protein
MEERSFSGWGIVELMGHKRIAGRLGERTIAGANLLQVDIPLSDKPDDFRTEFVGGGSIYALHPTDERTARLAAKRLDAKPVYSYDVEQQLRIEQRAADTVDGQPELRSPRSYAEENDGDDDISLF